MSLAPFSPQAPRTTVQGPDPAIWAQHRQTITRLYIHENKSLEYIMEFMAQNYNFHATQRMFKFRIKAWSLNKSLRPGEVLAMARVKARREATGRGADFWRYGRPVTPAKLERYLRDHPHIAAQLKKHVPEDVFTKGHIEALLPAHIVVLTPCRALKLDADMHSLEGLMASLDHYMKDGLSNYHALDMNHDSEEFWTKIGLEYGVGIWEVLGLLDQPHHQPQHRRVVNSILQSRFDELRPAVDIGHPGLIWGVLYTYEIIQYVYNRSEIATLWLSLARDYCIAVKGSGHPLSTAFSLFHEWRHSYMQSKAISLMCEAVCSFASKFPRHFGRDEALYIRYSWDIFGIVTRTTESYRTQNGFNAEDWTKCLEATSQRHEVILQVLMLLEAPDSEDFEFVLSWLEFHQWQDTDWLLVDHYLLVSDAYLDVGDAKMSFETIRDLFSWVYDDWRDLKMLAVALHVDSKLKQYPRETDGLEVLQDRVKAIWNQALEELVQSLQDVHISDEE
ncbi:Clr5 domain-containing protein [Dactylonectria macrodidyma]|uniref:Clr5 domain-containing protein n=1 Tax=Dactylonectria macrodidyma TaxID=307937 RepID=A0A9P9FGM0_9HYPO|nr:Clr5 domain-containing protein [Dactylonectria macrodidyma]